MPRRCPAPRCSSGHGAPRPSALAQGIRRASGGAVELRPDQAVVRLVVLLHLGGDVVVPEVVGAGGQVVLDPEQHVAARARRRGRALDGGVLLERVRAPVAETTLRRVEGERVDAAVVERLDGADHGSTADPADPEATLDPAGAARHRLTGGGVELRGVELAGVLELEDGLLAAVDVDDDVGALRPNPGVDRGDRGVVVVRLAHVAAGDPALRAEDAAVRRGGVGLNTGRGPELRVGVGAGRRRLDGEQAATGDDDGGAEGGKSPPGDAHSAHGASFRRRAHELAHGAPELVDCNDS